MKGPSITITGYHHSKQCQPCVRKSVDVFIPFSNKDRLPISVALCSGGHGPLIPFILDLSRSLQFGNDDTANYRSITTILDVQEASSTVEVDTRTQRKL